MTEPGNRPHRPLNAPASAERELTLQRNLAAFDAMSEEQLLVSPHLKHPRLREQHRRLVGMAADATGVRAADASVLELGAGDGLGSMPWFELGVGRIVAVDPSPVMLARFADRAARFGVAVETVVADADRFYETATGHFDVVSFASVLHHIADYLSAVRGAINLVRPGGSLVVFQDPLRFDRMPLIHRTAHRSAYLMWRLTRGQFRRGLRTAGRRLRGVYSAIEPSDYEEYHAVRNGVDSEAVVATLEPEFEAVREFRYWSTPARLLQALGEKLRFKSEFGIVATGRRTDRTAGGQGGQTPNP